MKRIFLKAILLIGLILITSSWAWAHFGMIIPSDNIVSKGDKKTDYP